ncbi:hypothetical protein BCR32DRAFT_282993 [Anaeromyces robustus]|uniref:Uncharacterized protein n=1 Tax=Anaeromyces robustus TaxID=1754192 RepID=A0A1Y1WVT0_9FUNG|nr:hypothetical protein BCR32DRAFT_282993 [Anaeromyces robustus]|eukprot:ORX77671.1 hypothetical protein BCR32DRAFT_282993 [Anaeromyces robustus]
MDEYLFTFIVKNTKFILDELIIKLFNTKLIYNDKIDFDINNTYNEKINITSELLNKKNIEKYCIENVFNINSEYIPLNYYYININNLYDLYFLLTLTKLNDISSNAVYNFSIPEEILKKYANIIRLYN